MGNGTIYVYVPIIQARQSYSSSVKYRTAVNHGTWVDRTTVNCVNFPPNGNTRTVNIYLDTNSGSYKYWLAYALDNAKWYETDVEISNMPTNYTYENYVKWLAENATETTQPDNISFTVVKDNYYLAMGESETQFDFLPVEGDKNYILVFEFPFYSSYYQNASIGAVYAKIQCKGENCTGDFNSGNFRKPLQSYWGTRYFTADDGYTWDYDNLENNFNHTSKYNTFTVSSYPENNQISLRYNGTNTPNTGDFSGYDDDIITLTPKVAGGYKLNITLENCTCNYTDGEIIPPETEITMQFAPNSANIGGYKFKNPPTFSDSSVVVDYNEETGIYTATFTPTEHTTINAVAIRYVYLSFNGLAFATCNIDETTKLFVDETYNIVVTADTGYYFDTAPYIAGFDYYSFPVNYVFTTDETGDYPKTYVYNNFNGHKYGTSNYSTLRAAAVVIPETDKYGIIKIYNPTPDELDTLSLTRIRRFTDGLGGVSFVDVGQYISGLIRIYVNIPEYDRERIILGGYDMAVDSAVVLRDIVQTDCGEITIEPYFNNVMDYENTTVKIYLPFRGFETLETAVVMGETLKLIYRTNVINGDTLILIYGNNERLLYTFECNCSFEVPYIINGQNQINGKLNIDSSYLYGFTPFIEISRDTAFNTAANIAVTDLLTRVGDLTGYNEITVTNLNIIATETERNEIERLLKEGVIL